MKFISGDPQMVYCSSDCEVAATLSLPDTPEAPQDFLPQGQNYLPEPKNLWQKEQLKAFFHQHLRDAIDRLDWGEGGLAHELGVSRENLSLWYRGKATPPGPVVQAVENKLLIMFRRDYLHAVQAAQDLQSQIEFNQKILREKGMPEEQIELACMPLESLRISHYLNDIAWYEEKFMVSIPKPPHKPAQSDISNEAVTNGEPALSAEHQIPEIPGILSTAPEIMGGSPRFLQSIDEEREARLAAIQAQHNQMVDEQKDMAGYGALVKTSLPGPLDQVGPALAKGWEQITQKPDQVEEAMAKYQTPDGKDLVQEFMDTNRDLMDDLAKAEELEKRANPAPDQVAPTIGEVPDVKGMQPWEAKALLKAQAILWTEFLQQHPNHPVASKILADTNRLLVEYEPPMYPHVPVRTGFIKNIRGRYRKER
jgi:hypothetical protein